MVLRPRMVRHGDDVTDLMWAVLLLDRAQTHALAERVVAEPRLARAHGLHELDTVNAALPPGFFVLQDELVTRAKAVAAASRQADDRVLSKAFGQLMETCVACHAAYLR